MKLMSADELERELRAIGARRYHRLHPFHQLLHQGRCTKGQVQAWALNRYYYQAMIPLKDAGLIARCDDPVVRREWRSRLVDHDGSAEGEGGIARWLKLTDGLALDRAYVISLRGLLTATRFAVDAYVRFVRERTLIEAIASSLTELFSPAIIGERVEGMLKGYSFVSRETLAYFDKRPPQAERDAGFALAYVKRNASTPDAQQVFADAVAGLQESGQGDLAWLYTVAKRRFVDELRRDAVARRVGALEVVPAEPTGEYGPQVAATLRRALERLPEGQRQVVVLKLLRGLPFAEIAARAGISVDATKMRFLRALETLRSELEREGVNP